MLQTNVPTNDSLGMGVFKLFDQKFPFGLNVDQVDNLTQFLTFRQTVLPVESTIGDG